MSASRIHRVTGTLVEAGPVDQAGLYELALVGTRQLLGEVIRLGDGTGTLQVYEETSGLTVGEPVEFSGSALTVELGPGLLGAILDGLGRPLGRLAELQGEFIGAGAAAPTLDPERRWTFEPALRAGDSVGPGDVLGYVTERPGFRHAIMVPPHLQGIIATLEPGNFTVAEPIGTLTAGESFRLSHRWPVRQPRPVRERLADDRPFITGQRVFDLLFPVAEGGTVAVPGGFGTGKTIIEQSLAKFADADVVVYVGCGERGNEMAEVLNEFPALVDSRTGRSIMDRTVMVVNTSNMPVAAREASVYLGMTIAEYYRDMGYRVALMADSLSRWAEALREISARLQEMPGEEGYPTYLASRLSTFNERAGRASLVGRPDRSGALTLISAISPPGGDFSEPVTQAALRVVGAMWALDPRLAHQRQFPAVAWETSYSLYADGVTAWFREQVGPDWGELRAELLDLLQRDGELREIAALIGPEALQDADRLILESARLVRDVILGQSAYSATDACSSIAKTYQLARLGVAVFRRSRSLLERGVRVTPTDFAALRPLFASLRDAGDDQLEVRARAVEDGLNTMAKGAGA